MSSIPEMLKLLPDPKSVWKFFFSLNMIPRESGHLECIQPALKALATSLGLDCLVDKGGNVIIRKPAAEGCEGKPGVVLQAHFDMVCEKNSDVEFDFKKDAIKPRIAGEWLTATGTSLGADNGIGIAAALAVLADDTLKTGPIEVLITRDEETGLFGAEELDPEVLKHRLLINLDSEEENAICVGCAGGHTTKSSIPMNRVAVDGVAGLRVHLSGCRGGHSGVEINLGRLNALKTVARLLKVIKSSPVHLVSFDSGTADNAIPREATAVIAVAAEDIDAVKAELLAEFGKIEAESRKIEPDVKMALAAQELTANPADLATSSKAIDFLNAVPSGVVRMSPAVKGLVETSFTMAIIATEEDKLVATASARSSRDSQMDMVFESLHSLCTAAGVQVEGPLFAYPGWDPKMESPLLDVMRRTHNEVLERDPRVYAIHAGLECGMIQGVYPDMDCVSIGPEIRSPHSPDEKLLIASVPRFYKWLCAALEAL